MKHLICILLTGFSFSSFAQFASGTFLLGGSGSYYQTKIRFDTNSNDEEKVSSFTFSPEAKYFFKNKENIALIFGLSYSLTKNNQTTFYNDLDKNSFGGFLGFQKYNFVSKNVGLSFGMSAGINRSQGNDGYANPSTDTRRNTFNFNIATIGAMYQFNDKFSLEGRGNLLGLTFYRETSDNANYSQNNKDVTIDFGLPTVSFSFFYALN